MYEKLLENLRCIDDYSRDKYSPFQIDPGDIKALTEKAVLISMDDSDQWIPLSQLATDPDDEFYITNWYNGRLG